MKTERCRDWRESLGAYALGHLAAPERAALEAHLEGCPDCREEVKALSGVAVLLPHADPERFAAPAPQPPADLGERIAATVAAEGKRDLGRRKRRRFQLAFGGVAATAAVAALLTLVVLPGSGETTPEQQVQFASLPSGVAIDATLEPHSFGTEIHMYVSGIRSGTLCRVFLRGADGSRYPAGSFRYRWGEDSVAVLSSALDLSRTEAIGVHAGNRTFIAPVDQATVSVENETKEDAT
ncbi:MAG: zf-HC2 domain-containing protein [Solirubrobacterales bacterium]|nr:zf-HC2 domain-containing protein [Solirubrobacterales bacterium]